MASKIIRYNLLILSLFLLTATSANAAVMQYRESWLATGFVNITFGNNRGEDNYQNPVCAGVSEWYVRGQKLENIWEYREIWSLRGYRLSSVPIANHSILYIDNVTNNTYSLVSLPSDVQLDEAPTFLDILRQNGTLAGRCKNKDGYILNSRRTIARPVGEYGVWIAANDDEGTDSANRALIHIGGRLIPTDWKIRGVYETP